jgi:hypothetical protein
VPGTGGGTFVDMEESILYCLPGEWNVHKYIQFRKEETRFYMDTAGVVMNED